MHRLILFKPMSRTHSPGSTVAKILFIFTYYAIVSQRTINERLTLYLTPPTNMLFFSNLNFTLALPSLPYSRDNSREQSREGAPLEEVEESRMVIDALRMVPYGFRILLRISLNYCGTYVDCHVSY